MQLKRLRLIPKLLIPLVNFVNINKIFFPLFRRKLNEIKVKNFQASYAVNVNTPQKLN